MAIIDDVTINYSIPMPNIANDIADDIARLRSAFTNIDACLLGKADIMPATQPLSITATNAISFPPFFRIPPRDVEFDSVIIAAASTDKWIDGTGTWSDPEVTSITFNDLKGIGGNFTPTAFPVLTELSFPALTDIGGTFAPSYLFALTALSFPELVRVGGNFTLNFINKLPALSLPKLRVVGGNFSPYGLAELTTLSCPELVVISNQFAPSSVGKLTTLLLPKLRAVGGSFNLGSLPVLTELSLPELVTIGSYFSPSNMQALTSISLDKLERIGAGSTLSNTIQLSTNTPNLTTLNIPATLKQVGNGTGNVYLTSCNLNQASVDNLLVRLAALDGTNGTVAFNNRTVTITGTSASPSAIGLAAKSTLVARGCTVSHR